MCRRQVLAVCEFVDFFRRQPAKEKLRRFAKQRVAQAVDALEAFEKQHEFLDVRRAQFFVEAVERMAHCMGDLVLREIFLQIVNVLLQRANLAVLALADAPHEQVDLAAVSGKAVLTCSLMNVPGRSAISRQPSMRL